MLMSLTLGLRRHEVERTQVGQNRVEAVVGNADL
jgi:hypothetical protein